MALAGAGEVWEDLLSKLVFELVEESVVNCIRKGESAAVPVQLHPDPLRLLLQNQVCGDRGSCPVLSRRQANAPQTPLWIWREPLLPVDALPGHAQGPFRVVPYLHVPDVLPRVKSLGAQHTLTGPEPLWVVGKVLVLVQVSHRRQVIRHGKADVCRVGVQCYRGWGVEKLGQVLQLGMFMERNLK